MKKIIFSSAIIAFIASGFSHAGVILGGSTCSKSSVQITQIKEVIYGGLDENIVTEGDIDATSCLGFIADPHNDFGNEPNPNNGKLGVGLLNGEVGGQGHDAYFVPGEQFLTNPADSMVDVTGGTNLIDPGWIHLGDADTEYTNDVLVNGVSEYKFNYDSIGPYDLGSVIDMSFRVDGTWSLEVDPSAIAAASAALGRPSVFDHLAFVLKGNRDDDYGSWAIYDFNFHDLITDYGVGGLAISLGDTPYYFEGKWDVNLFSNNGALSHMSVWAHDPPAGSIPEPSTLAIFLLGMIGLGSRRFKKQA
ncbi:PEP-CTERM sorting domain-containing protein [Colwellia sp. BRX8-4]|uniref:PEP-CTERM sorting domain-containing protein n=1 Tax=Colwellia sp. BRX8-4 TaxID=2759836 RepID=UPI0015F3A19E|nr:PEP-CTERM sorting domain-containing protein [Colwellia sp. BRX8-4]MBA6364238.1 PEP-CTERM sorting domain-containing protein [Colwellia sp. BRX8-8]MBA6370022.1 PEP-CTERM sorting domain-containing protein [Colwellia sp. BRX8-4]